MSAKSYLRVLAAFGCGLAISCLAIALMVGCAVKKPAKPIVIPPEFTYPTDCEDVFDAGDMEANRCAARI